MRNKLSVSKLLIGLLIISVIPVIINFILSCRNPILQFEVIGSQKDWIAFYGSYIGSIIAIGGTLYVLFSTLNSEKKKQEIELRYTEYLELRQKLAYNLSRLHYKNILSDVEALIPIHSSVIPKLINMYIEADNIYNSFIIIYREPTYSDLVLSLHSYIIQYHNAIDKTIKLLQTLEYNALTNVATLSYNGDDYKRIVSIVEGLEVPFNQLGNETQVLLDKIRSDIESIA